MPAVGQTASAGTSQAPATQHSRIEKINGLPVLIVDGKPFFILGAQLDVWRGMRRDDKVIAFFDGFQQMNATAVGADIPWARLEPEKDHYDFSFMDWYIAQAEAHGLKLVLQLFNSNICGKVGGAGEPAYTPDYIANAPHDYDRMQLNEKVPYLSGGPPMSPNDPRVLERERLLVVKIAEHLKQTDLKRTVIMLQIDNEFHYQSWVKEKPRDLRAVRDRSPWSEKKFATGRYKDGLDFMFHSFADYVKVLSDAITQVYDLPLYLNDPWWSPEAVPIFLDTCPNVSLIGMDGVNSPAEPNHLTAALLGRNLPFAAENPTEDPQVRYNLDVLPWYTVIGEEGIGNLLWECHPPFTVVDDPQARARYGAALYPLKNAMAPIALARGTDRLDGWYTVRAFAKNLKKDAQGNFIPEAPGQPVVQRSQIFIREGSKTRQTDEKVFSLSLAGLKVDVSESVAGVILQREKNEVILATSGGIFYLAGVPDIHAESGYFAGEKWTDARPFTVQRSADVFLINATQPVVLRLTF